MKLTQEIIDKILTINNLYEKARVVEKRKRREYLQSKGKDYEEESDSEDAEVESFDIFTPNATKTPVRN